MEAWQAVTLGLAALLVGVLVPSALQLALALRAWRATAERAGTTLATVTATVERLDQLTARLERDGRVERLLEAAAGLTVIAGGLQDAVRLATAAAAAVGPAVGAAVRSWRASRADDGPALSGEFPREDATT